MNQSINKNVDEITGSFSKSQLKSKVRILNPSSNTSVRIKEEGESDVLGSFLGMSGNKPTVEQRYPSKNISADSAYRYKWFYHSLLSLHILFNPYLSNL